jgi:murein DD-endopeptidase MepM/ murein hydrolase activator NlpD
VPRLPTGPFKTGRTGCFGCVRKSPSDGGCGVAGYPCVHRGLDMFAESPDVFAPEAGIVVRVSDGKTAPFVGFGPGVVLIQGASGFFHLLSHLDFSTIKVKPGQPVVEGQLLAQFEREHGHTHYEVRRKATGPSETNNIDPAVWLANEQRKTLVAQQAAQQAAPSGAGRNLAIGFVVVASLAGLGWLTLYAVRQAGTSPRFV